MLWLCGNMGYKDEYFLYIPLFTGGQVVVPSDSEDSSYIMWMLVEECQKL
jgi:hypothetical protein